MDQGSERTFDVQESGRPEIGLIRQFRLRVESGEDQGAEFLCATPTTVIGTHESADWRLRDRTVSRFHCRLSMIDGRVLVADLGSRNQTRINGVSVREAFLDEGAALQLGKASIRFSASADHVPIPLSKEWRFGGMVGRSALMRNVFSLLERAATADVTVLIEGETGTGKELAADALHRASLRRNGPFVIVDCGTLPPNLLESELFGHVRGAFTGAIADRDGAFAAASGGTLFLDEIGELSPDFQPKLLRALESREIRPVGGARYLPVDVRIIAATNRNLGRAVNDGSFRSDLYYRLAVFSVRLPRLEERREDLPLLVEDLLAKLGVPQPPAWVRSPAFLEQLASHPWPGNLRELRNYLERCVVLAEPAGLIATPQQAVEPTIDLNQPLRVVRDQIERQYLSELMRAHKHNVAAAALAADMDRTYFYRLLARHRLR
jgi:transcriptional regulator with GAF, ATPase, and Fis domain